MRRGMIVARGHEDLRRYFLGVAGAIDYIDAL